MELNLAYQLYTKNLQGERSTTSKGSPYTKWRLCKVKTLGIMKFLMANNMALPFRQDSFTIKQ